ncbi:hypothetical protein ACQPZJ_32235 [Actinoplanes sp. CA-054009]
MAPEVVAAWIAAAVAAGAAAANLYFSLHSERRRRDAEMMVTALAYFEGRSQRRSAGLAALEVLKSRSSAWAEYRDTVRQLFYRQLLYLFPHGENRWDSHEVANIERMAEWLLDGKSLPTPSDDMRDRIRSAVERYAEDWSRVPAEKRKAYDGPFIDQVIKRVRELCESR